MIIYAENSKNSRFYPNSLYRDYIFDFPGLSKYFNYDYRDIESYRKRIKNIEESYDNDFRKEIVEILQDYNSALGASSETLKNIKMLGKSKTVVIIGGQQPGLFTGPLFVLYKIITVLKLSKFLNKISGICTVPCFWNASDDSSIDQVDSIGFLTDTEERIILDTSEIKKNTRFSDIYLEKEKYLEAVRSIAQLLSEMPFKSEVTDFLEDCTSNKFRDPLGRRRIGLPGFFSNIITKLFRKNGIVIIDPADKRLKRLGKDFFEIDIENHHKITKEVNSLGDKLEREGYHRQLDKKQNTLNHFFNVKNIREKIEYTDDLYRVRDKMYSKKEIIDIYDADSGLFSWNVVMRPLIQDSLFPVLATVCGPGEISYFAQISGVYKLLDTELPVIYPRFSATIIERNINKIIKRLGGLDDLIKSDRVEAIKSSVNNTKINIEDMMEDLENKLEESINGLEKKMSGAGLSIGNSSDRIKRNIKKEVKVFKQKIYSEQKRSDQWLESALERFYMNLFPGGKLQERWINFFYFASKYGIGFLEVLYDSFIPFDFEHKLLFLDQEQK